MKNGLICGRYWTDLEPLLVIKLSPLSEIIIKLSSVVLV